MNAYSHQRQTPLAAIPILLTLGNAVCGFGSITFATKVGPDILDSNYLYISGWLIFAAMLFDMLDGTAARWTKQVSEFGAQLDSLCDAISFGVAPAFIMLKLSQNHHPRMLWLIAAFFMICTVLRLARFNVETGDEDSHETFSGLPSPAAAGLVGSFAIALPRLPEILEQGLSDATSETEPWMISMVRFCLPIITLIVAFLMVSRVRYPHICRQLMRGGSSRRLLQVLFAIVAVLAFRELAIPLILCVFTLGAPLRALWQGVLVRGGFSLAAAAINDSCSALADPSGSDIPGLQCDDAVCWPETPGIPEGHA